MKLFLKWLARACVLSAVVYFLWQLSRYSELISMQSFAGVDFWTALGSVFLVLGNVFVGAVIWYLVLPRFEMRISFLDVVSVYLVSQFGKYLPGNVAHHVGRVFMAKRLGIPPLVSVNAMAIEILWALCVGVILSLMAVSFDGEHVSHVSWFFESKVSLWVWGVGLLFVPWFLVKFLKIVVPNLSGRVFDFNALFIPGFSCSVGVVFLIAAGFFVIGVSLSMQLSGLFGLTDVSLRKLMGAFAVAWVAGYVIPGAPAGLGVREAVMILLLGPEVGEGVAAGLGLTFRATTFLADFLAFVLGWLILFSRTKNNSKNMDNVGE